VGSFLSSGYHKMLVKSMATENDITDSLQLQKLHQFCCSDTTDEYTHAIVNKVKLIDFKSYYSNT